MGAEKEDGIMVYVTLLGVVIVLALFGEHVYDWFRARKSRKPTVPAVASAQQIPTPDPEWVRARVEVLRKEGWSVQVLGGGTGYIASHPVETIIS